MIFIVKVFLSVAMVCFAVGYASRRRANPLHRQLMAAGVLVAWTAVVVLLLGRFGLGLPLRPAFWLVELTGSARAADIIALVQQSLGLLALLVLSAQALLGRLRHPLHRPVAWGAIPLWLLVWVTAMFGYV
ncbi:MAG TPA: hypothetical protein VKB51_15945 [bacterium]|nr:hypothetical protein [bacterium]